MAVPTVYRWDDANAPQITDIHDWTQIKDFFDKIFVTGYLEDDNVTAKPALGWNVTVDDGGNKITLDMVGDPVTENLMRIENYFSEQVAGKFGAGRIVYEHQSNNLIVNSATNAFTSWMGQNDDDLKICPWIIIGTTRGLWVLAGQNGSTPTPTVPTQFTDTDDAYSFSYFGNYINDGVDLGKNNQCALNGGTITSEYSTYAHLAQYNKYRYDGAAYGVSTIRDFQNNLTIINDELVHYESFIGTSSVKYLATNNRGLAYPYIDGGLYIKPFQMYHKTSNVYYGRMAGMYYPEHIRPLYASPSQLVEFTGTGEYAGEDFIGVSSSQYNEFYINISEDWDI